MKGRINIESRDDFDEPGAPVPCWQCGGEGILIVCIDDMCRGAGECIHGDGEEMCSACGGDGYV